MTHRLLMILLEELPQILEDRDRERLLLERARGALRSIHRMVSREGSTGQDDVKRLLGECADLWRTEDE